MTNLLTDLIGYWKLDGDSTDSGPFEKDGTDTDITYHADYGKIDQGAYFDGAGCWINLPTDTNTNSEYTISQWAWGSGTNDDYTFDAQSGRTITGFISGLAFKAYDGTWRSTGIDTQSDESWHHYVVIHDHTINSTKIYVDNILKYDGSANDTGISGTMKIGARYSGSNNWQGYIDEFGIWNRPITEAEVAELWNGGAGLTHPFEAAGLNMQINIADAWKTVAGAQINIGDSWKVVASIQQNIGDTWKVV